jgi:hypothetical protein
MSFTPSYTYYSDANGQVWQVNVATDGSFVQTPVSGVPPQIPPSTFFNTTAGDIINSVIRDAQVLATNRDAILDYVDRVCQRILRDTQWVWLRSQPQRFITQPGATDYYIGAGSPPAGSIPTGLGLIDVWSVWGESVFDRTHSVQLMMNSASSMNSVNLSFKDGSWRPAPPRSFKYEMINPYVLSLYPIPDNQNIYQPVPVSPICTPNTQGTVASRVYYVYATYVDDQGNESSGSIVPTVIYLPANTTLTAKSPLPEVASAAQVNYSKWNCYVGTTPTNATLQNVSPILVGTPYVETTSGQVLNGVNLPTVNNLDPMLGYVIEFRYYRTRQLVNSIADVIQIPDYYRDVVIAGCNYYYNLYINNKEVDSLQKAAVWKQEWTEGIKQIRKDLNISFRNTDFISPDPATQVSQALGQNGYAWGSI